ncbi:tandem-95 repeat protein, partial [Candidatus Woesearchaeota archaeon]|nr:tandem-95 repeat protein [Candidatus Woesearchaeota archaeon]
MKIRRNLAIFSVVILLFSIISPGIAAQGVAACDGILADNRGSTPHVVDEEDFNKFSGSFGSELGDANFNPGADLNNDDKVDYGDFDILNGLSGQSCNLAPVITSSAPTTAAENSPYTYTITVSDPENDGLAYSLPTKPSGMTMSQRQISWTPSFTQADTHNVQISISDTPPGGIAPQTATQSFAITVSNTNRAPTINSIPDRQMNEGETFSYNVIAADPDGDVLSYSLTQNPSGMSIGSDGVISWTPSFAQSESHSVAVQVSDSAATATRSFTINVADVNVPPTLSISSQSVNENQLLQFTVTPVDPDGDGIASLTASGLPSGATFAGNTFTWTPSFGQAGSYPVEFTATDSKGASSTQSVAIEVSIGNHLPDSWISIPRANNFITTETHPVPFVRREVGYLDYFAGHGSDSDGAVVRYEWDLDGAATNFNEADSVLRLDTPGDFDVSFRVKDNSNAYSDPYEPATPSAFRLVVDRKAQMDFDTFVGSNTPANLANNRIDVSIGSIIWFRIFAGNDPDGELMGDFVKEFRVEFQDGSLFYSPYFSNPGNVVVTDDSTGRYSYKILNEDESFFSEVKLVFNSIGEKTVRLIPTDTFGLEGEPVELTINVVPSPPPEIAPSSLPQNNPPAANPQSASVNEDNSVAITLTGSDPENNILTFSITSNPSSGALSGFNAATGAVTYTPNANFNGADSFAFKVNDGTVDSNTAATVSMTINSVNDAPTANSQSVTTTEDTAKAITLAGSDVEGSALAFSIAANPTKGVLSGFNSATGAVTYMPNADASGADSFAFKVNDGTVDSNTATVSISINSINDAPVLNAIGPQSITEGQLLTFAVTGSDADLDTLTFSAAGLPSGASFAGNTFTWAPGFVQAGSYPVTFTVSDGTATASETVIVTIIEAGNQAPVLGAIGDRAVTEGQALAITLSATDPDGTGALTFTSSPLPSGATLIGNAFSWTPSFTQAGSQSITFIVSDGSLQDSETVTITVNEAGNQAPVLDPISPQSVTEAQTLTFT